MTKIKLFFAVIITSLALVFVPVKQEAQAACNVVCLLEMGGQSVQDAGAWIKGILGTVWQTVSKWLSDAAAWIDKYMQKAWGGTSKGLDKIGLKDFKSPNLRDKSTGIEANKSYNLTVADKSGSNGKTVSGKIGAAGTSPVMTNVAETKGAIEKRAAAKANELLSVEGTLQGRTLEEQQKAYIAQQEAIDGLAKALVAKNYLADLERLAKELDELMVTIQQGAADAPETSTNNSQSMSGIVPATGHNMGAAIKNNISVRLLWDELLTMQQQVMAMRLKANTVQAIRDMEYVSEMIEIEEPGTSESTQTSSTDTNKSSLEKAVDTLSQDSLSKALENQLTRDIKKLKGM